MLSDRTPPVKICPNRRRLARKWHCIIYLLQALLAETSLWFEIVYGHAGGLEVRVHWLVHSLNKIG